MKFVEKDDRCVHRMLASFSAIILIFQLVSCQPKAKSVTLALLGDLMIGRDVEPMPVSFSYLGSELKAADLSLANLESPLAISPPTTTVNEGYNLCATADRTDLIAGWGLDLLSLANNHRFDCSPNGPVETSSILSRAGLHPIGPGPGPLYQEINSLKLGFLAFDDILSPMDASAAVQAIQAARDEGALVIVSVHWGAEFQQGASTRQKTLARQFSEAGAVLVVGTHPHVLQPSEWIHTASGKTLVIYSLGNALFDQRGLADTRQSALVVVTLDPNGVKFARAVPFEIDASSNVVIQPEAETSRQILNRLHLP